MAKISETGYAVSIANFKELVQHCQSFGNNYNPSVPELQLTNLQNYAATAESQLTTANTANASYKDNIAQRAVLYKHLDALATRLRNAIQIYNVLPQVQQQIINFTKKIQGTSTRKKTNTPSLDATGTNDATDPKTISTSQTSFEQRLNTLDKIVQTLSNQPQYNPNETDLQVNTLATLVQNLRSLNDNALTAEIDKKTATLTLRNLLYNEDTSLKKVAAKIKMYIKSVFGSKSAEYSRISKVKV